MADCAAIKTRLDQAIAAYDRLQTGKSVLVVVDGFRSRIEYAKADQAQLYAYIQQLQVQYNQCVGGQPALVITRPLNFVF
jgi:hypothetical protein